ncbi:hypothetical protein [Symbiopectobacterium purcellii]|uniref:Uncharacterized protein n=1 Tax=Symbiopectobacterium purcellii TaxID=2871826 RepID=A0ABX9AQP2_9ENTR|nr:hypothetical protein [Symbiopectobacterium purcellii]QZN97358.1 hypothetical protein K6K13_08460 [Symbiopectobacterium purcellii]
MANAFDFELTANDQASATVIRIEEAIRRINPQLDKTKDGLKLGGSESVDSVAKINKVMDGLGRSAKDSVQFIGDIVPPLKMITGLTAGLGGVATAINAAMKGMTNFANYGYRMDTTAKNISMSTRALQELTGAMVENGSKREDAENALVDLFNKAGDAKRGQNAGFMGLLLQEGIDIHPTKEGLVDIGRLIDDINQKMQTLSPGKQALWSQKLALSPELLSYLRNTTEQVQKLKDQAQRDGLILSDKDVQNAVAFRQNINEISSRYDGLILKSQAWLGKESDNPTSKALREMKKHDKDDENQFYHGDKQQDMMARARRDKEFKDALTFKEGVELAIGRPGKPLQDKLNRKYSIDWTAQQLQKDMATVNPPRVYEPANPANGPFNEPSSKTLGLRNNNPGNLRTAPNTTGSNGGFATFASPNDGLAAMARQLMLYGDRGTSRLNDIISTYAPPRENDTRSYIRAVSQTTGYEPSQPLNLHDPATLQTLMAAMIKHENKAQPFSGRDIMNGIANATHDARWSGLRDSNNLYAQRNQNLSTPTGKEQGQRDERWNALGGRDTLSPVRNQNLDDPQWRSQRQVSNGGEDPLRDTNLFSLGKQSPVRWDNDDHYPERKQHTNDPIFSPSVPEDERQVGQSDATVNQQNQQNASDSIFRQQDQGRGDVIADKVSNAIRSVLVDNKMQIEVTLVDDKTGEKKTFSGTGPKISTAMQW